MANADDPREALARSGNAECATCQTLLEEWMTIDGRLTSVGQHARETLAAADAIQGAPGEQLVDELLRPRLEGARRGPARRWALAGLAATLAVFLLLVVRRDPPASPDRALGSRGWSLTAPVQGEGYGRFSWTGPEDHAGWFEVRVYDGGPAGALLSQREDLDEREWRPAATLTASWPDRVRWQVLIYDASGLLSDALTGEASR